MNLILLALAVGREMIVFSLFFAQPRASMAAEWHRVALLFACTIGVIRAYGYGFQVILCWFRGI